MEQYTLNMIQASQKWCKRLACTYRVNHRFLQEPIAEGEVVFLASFVLNFKAGELMVFSQVNRELRKQGRNDTGKYDAVESAGPAYTCDGCTHFFNFIYMKEIGSD